MCFSSFASLSPCSRVFWNAQLDLLTAHTAAVAGISDGRAIVNGAMRRLCGILLLCLVPAIASHCPSHVSSRIQECVRPVAEYAKLLNSDQDRGNPRASNADLGTAFSLPNMGRRVFNGLCKSVIRLPCPFLPHYQRANAVRILKTADGLESPYDVLPVYRAQAFGRTDTDTIGAGANTALEHAVPTHKERVDPTQQEQGVNPTCVSG
ncbi:unnamed protein product [Heligmosomoides polygyrus]|uniref:Secreted protein n=1 Tax=Heligmosomoides polygyrus TaxID=6339 RepID=A0A183GCH6_HELPZ|nr:unnamed protein product [Heligmosomoides polygyrus]